MPYALYKVVHYLGIFLLVTTLGAALGRKVHHDGEDPWRKRFGAIHGSALFLILLGGFGMLARLEVAGGVVFPGWVWFKLVIWVVLGGVLAVARRSAPWSDRMLWIVPLLAALAGFLAFVKPF